MSKQIMGVSPTSLTVRFKLMNSSVSTGAGLTGLVYNSTGLVISTIKKNDASAVVYSTTANTIETITTLGTYAAPSSNKCRFKEVDATNHPGIYELHLADARYNATDSLLVSINGVTNLAQTDFEIECKNIAVNVIQIGGTAQTARDLGASVLISSGTGTGQLDVTSGVIKANLVQILATALTETAGYLAAGFKKFFNVTTPVSTVASVDQTGDSYAVVNGRLPAALTANGNMKSSLVEILTTALTETTGYLAAAFKKFFNISSPSLTTAGIDQTGDSYVRIGSPAGASVSADVAAIEANAVAIKAKTDNLPANPAAVGSAMTLATNAVDASQFTQAAADKVWGTTTRQLTGTQAFNLTGNIIGNLDGNVTGSVDSVTDPVTVGSNNDKTGYALTSAYDAAKTAAQASNLATLDGKVVDVKAKTDQLAFTSGLINSQSKGMDTDVISAAAVSAAAVTKIQSGLATGGDLTTINGKLDTIYTTEGTIINDITAVGNAVAEVVAVLPSSGNISNIALTDNIDGGVQLKDVLIGVLAMTNGRFKKDYPSSGQVTFYKRDNSTVAFVMEITDTERTRT